MDYITHGVTKSWTRLTDFYFHMLELRVFKFLALCLTGGKVQNLTLSMDTFHYKCNVISPASS